MSLNVTKAIRTKDNLIDVSYHCLFILLNFVVVIPTVLMNTCASVENLYMYEKHLGLTDVGFRYFCRLARPVSTMRASHDMFVLAPIISTPVKYVQ